MYSKSIGSTILFLTALYYSFTRQKQERYVTGLLEELCELFAYIEKGIGCYTIPLGEIYRGFTSPLLEDVGFYGYWHAGELEKAVKTIPDISVAVREAMKQYAENAGTGYKDTELQLCRNIRNELESARERQKNEMNTRNKLYRTLPFLLAISVVLLLA